MQEKTNGYQINKVTSGNNAATDGVITNPERGALAVFANYLRFTGRMDLLGSITNNAFSIEDLNRIIMIS